MKSFSNILNGFMNQMPTIVSEMQTLCGNFVKICDSEEIDEAFMQRIIDDDKAVMDFDLNKLEDELKLKPQRLNKKVDISNASPAKLRNSNSLQNPEDDLKDIVNKDLDVFKTNDQNYKHFELKKSLIKKFCLSQQDIYFDSYNCAIAFKCRIPIQGKLYIFSTKFCFYSPFNKKNIFFGETILIIPFCEITNIEKRVNSLQIHNTIHIHTINGKIIFTSFQVRDKAYANLEHLRKFNSYGASFDERIDNQTDAKNDDGDGAEDGGIEQYNNEILAKRKEKIDAIIAARDYPAHTDVTLNYTFEDFRLLEILSIYLGLNNVCSNEEGVYPGAAQELLKREFLSYNLGKWEPSLPSFIGTLEPIQWAKEYKVINTNSQKIDSAFASIVNASENTSLFLITPYEAKLITEVRTNGAPMTDTFSVFLNKHFKEERGPSGKPQLILKEYMVVKILKQHMFTGLIIRETLKKTVALNENKLMPYFQEGTDFYNERPQSKQVYKFLIEDVADETPEQAIKTLKGEMSEALTNIKTKNTEKTEELMKNQQSMEFKLMIFQIIVGVLVLCIFIMVLMNSWQGSGHQPQMPHTHTVYYQAVSPQQIITSPNIITEPVFDNITIPQ